ncbi:MAG: transcriptional regulator [Acidobacteria bacterium]|nr:MAG: transcriptional regulator [Acidobacteriota bacterium]
MSDNSRLATIGALVGDPGRANMLAALLDGRALTAAELAAHAGVTPQTASGHLSKLIATGLVMMKRQGRHRYHWLASPEVAGMLESMGRMAAGQGGGGGVPIRVGPRDEALRAARTCYDHLAGRLAVGLADAMAARGHIEIDRDGGVVTREGAAFLRDLGIDVGAEAPSKRRFCRTCLDWSERRLHLAGVLGAALMRRCFELHWVRRIEGTRALAVTAGGEDGFGKVFGLAVSRITAVVPAASRAPAHTPGAS